MSPSEEAAAAAEAYNVGDPTLPVDGTDPSDAAESVDLELGVVETKAVVDSGTRKKKRDCRICQLSMDFANHEESEVPIELGCSCKDDLAACHKHCAEAWFKIKGNKTCEICGSLASNVGSANEAELMEHWNEGSDPVAAAAASTPAHPLDTRRFWHGHRFLNFLLACMVFAFVISWLFHFNVPS